MNVTDLFPPKRQMVVHGFTRPTLAHLPFKLSETQVLGGCLCGAIFVSGSEEQVQEAYRTHRGG